MKAKFLIITVAIFFNTAHAQTNNISSGQKSYAIVGNLESREIAKNVFIANGGVIARTHIGGSHWEPIKLVDFSILVIRDTSVIFKYKNKGNRFEEEVLSAFQNLQSGDLIIIFNIDVQIADESHSYLKPLEYSIK